MPKQPDSYDEIDTGPLTKAQMQGLARDQIEAVRNTAHELWRHHKVACDILLLDRLQFQLCGCEDRQ